MHAGIRVAESTPVYETMLGKVPPDIDPRKRAMTLGHLLSMTGGHFCDDGNPEAPGNEDVMQEQERERDWYRYILSVPMDRTPGEKLAWKVDGKDLSALRGDLYGAVLASGVVTGTMEAPRTTFERMIRLMVDTDYRALTG